MNIFIRELKANLKSLLIWCGAQFFIIFAGMVKYSGFSKSDVDINALFKDLPQGLKAVFGVGELDLTQIEGFYSIFFLFFMLLAAIHAAMIGAVIISKEERDHSADFLFSKPVSRRRIITAKLLAGLFNILVFNLVTLFSSFYFISLYNDGDPLAGKVTILMAALLIFQLLFLFMGSALGAILKTTRQATSLATGILLGTFFISIAIDMDNRLDFLKYITPFKYFEADSLMFGGHLQLVSLVLCAILIGLGLVLTYTRFCRRDLLT